MRTNQQIIDQTNAVARVIYSHLGYQTPEGEEFHTERVNRHPHEVLCWEAACDIQELVTFTDVREVLEEMEEETGE